MRAATVIRQPECHCPGSGFGWGHRRCDGKLSTSRVSRRPLALSGAGRSGAHTPSILRPPARSCDELAQLETLEQGKSLPLARMFGPEAGSVWTRFAAGLATKITGHTVDPSLADRCAGPRFAAKAQAIWLPSSLAKGRIYTLYEYSYNFGTRRACQVAPLGWPASQGQTLSEPDFQNVAVVDSNLCHYSARR